jgi:hypothetical protein
MHSVNPLFVGTNADMLVDGQLDICDLVFRQVGPSTKALAHSHTSALPPRSSSAEAVSRRTNGGFAGWFGSRSAPE